MCRTSASRCWTDWTSCQVCGRKSTSHWSTWAKSTPKWSLAPKFSGPSRINCSGFCSLHPCWISFLQAFSTKSINMSSANCTLGIQSLQGSEKSRWHYWNLPSAKTTPISRKSWSCSSTPQHKDWVDSNVEPSSPCTWNYLDMSYFSATLAYYLPAEPSSVECSITTNNSINIRRTWTSRTWVRD